MHSAPLPGLVKTRVFRDCRANQKGATGHVPRISDACPLPPRWLENTRLRRKTPTKTTWAWL